MGAGICENLIESGSYPPLLGKSLVDAWLAVSGAMKVRSSGGEPGKAKPKGKTKVPAKAKAKAKATISISRAANSSSDEELVEAKPKRKAKVQATTKVKAESSINRAAYSSEEEPAKAKPQASSGEKQAKIRKSWTTADSDSN